LSFSHTPDYTSGVFFFFYPLAQVMIDLKAEKQSEIRQFLTWIEDSLRIIPDGNKTGLPILTGYTIIENYLGDYEKGEGELS
jgi:hypothetical protein